MDNKINTDITVSYVYEGGMARMERMNRRLWIVVLVLIAALIVTIAALIVTNAAWLYYENQFEDVEVTQEVDTGEGDAFVAGYGDVNYGEGKTDG